MPTLTREEEKQLRQEWSTPVEFINATTTFDIDVCATAENTKAPEFISKEHNALEPGRKWLTLNIKKAWCNPGFSDLAPWCRKAMLEISRMRKLYPHVFGYEIWVMSLISCSADWWQKYALRADEIRLLAPRVQFEPAPGIDKSSNARENCVLIYRSHEHYPLHEPKPLIWTWNWKDTMV